MRRRILILAAGGCVWSTILFAVAVAQSPPDPDYVRQQIYPSYQDFKSDLLATVAIADPVERAAELNLLWSALKTAGQVPYAQGNQVAFLYRGAASSVAWPGDFNGWSTSSASWRGSLFAGTDLWILEKTFPTDARLDYKIVTNGSSWILDPANPLEMWGGFGPNNELRMPDYVFPQETVRHVGVPQGTLSGNVTTVSTNLGYSVNHRVYTPAGYDAENLSDLPVVYVTDGHEYAADHLGSMVVVLDNLIASGALQPTMAVFIDPRDPNNLGNNRRMSEYTGNANFASFVADELVPLIDGQYRTDVSAEARVILGTSLGGVNSAYFGGTRSDVFGKIAVQSPSSFNNIFNLYSSQSLQDDVEVFITHGTIGDGSGGTTFANLLDTNGYDYMYISRSEGHSWGQWRGVLDEILVELIGPPPIAGDFDGDGDVDGRDFLVWQRNPSVGALADWQAGYGMGALIADLPPAEAGSAVPEPGVFALILPALLSCGCRLAFGRSEVRV